MENILLIISIFVTLMFFIYGYNCFYLIGASRGYKIPKRDLPVNERPPVAVHLPVYNEKYVVGRLLESCTNMAESYGKELVRTMILDDSSDETTQELEMLARTYSSQGFRMEVIHRENRAGYKAGALQKALERTSEDYIVIFDSDFLPPPNFLMDIIPHIAIDEKVGIVQGRWSYLNREYNFITRAVAIGMNAHFLIEQPGRYASQCFLNFNGSGGVIRSKALRDAGGWQSDTLAEDLDASYRIQMKGYRVLFLRDVLAPCELTPTITSFKRQQGRWACGSLQTAKKILPSLLREKTVGRKQKMQALVHLTYYLVHPLIFTSFLLALIAGILGIDTIGLVISIPAGLGQDPSRALEQITLAILNTIAGQPFILLAVTLLFLCWAAVWILYLIALRTEGLSIIRSIPNLIVIGIIGFGISINNTIQAAKALLSSRKYSFERTPKYALKRSADEWKNKKYQVPLNKTLYLEIIAVVLCIITIGKALQQSNIGLVFILVFYMISYAVVSILTFIHSGREG
ncbi:MAG: hypothetical protein QG670_1763 [Thermoproteota archaeon]|nr:hypothetical protein [Thermoproteota archaeon]